MELVVNLLFICRANDGQWECLGRLFKKSVDVFQFLLDIGKACSKGSPLVEITKAPRIVPTICQNTHGSLLLIYHLNI